MEGNVVMPGQRNWGVLSLFMLALCGCDAELNDSMSAQHGFTPDANHSDNTHATQNVDPIAASGTVSRLPIPGDLIISEILYDPDNGLEDVYAEWVEVRSLTQDPLTLDDCYIADISHIDDKRAQADLSGIELPGNGIALVVRSNEAAYNGGLRADATFSFGLGNGGDTVILGCANVVLDEVAFDAGHSFPTGKGRAIQRGTERWCPATLVYHEPSNQMGTPGTQNPECSELTLDACWSHQDCQGELRCIEDQCGSESGCQTEDDCEEGLGCLAGECIDNTGTVGAIRPGMVVISEFLYDPVGELSDRKAEWIELKNTTEDALTLTGCYVADSGSGAQWSALDGVTIEAGGFGLMVRSEGTLENGGLEADETFRFNLNNTGDEVRFICGEDILDIVTYGTADFSASGASLSRSGPVDGVANQLGIDWCVSTSIYFDEPTHYGTPGQPNPPCP